MVKQVEQRSDRQISLLVELWVPEAFQDVDLDAVEMAASFAATVVADLCRGGGGRLTLSVAAADSFLHSGSPSPALRNTVLDYLATAKASPDVQPFAQWLEAGAGGGGGSSSTAVLITTRPVEDLASTVERLPDWVGRVPRISVRDPDFEAWFQLAAE